MYENFGLIDPSIKPGVRKEFYNHYHKIINFDGDGYDCKAKSDFQDKKVGINICYCLRATNFNTHILDGYLIRKVKPIERWRLMGFDDEDFYKASQFSSNTQLCKQVGNSIVVPVLEAIFTNLLLGGNNENN